MINIENMVWVRWIDSSGCTGWKSEADLARRQPSEIISVGIVIRDDPSVLALVLNVDKVANDNHEDYACDLITIPRVAILEGPYLLVRETMAAYNRLYRDEDASAKQPGKTVELVLKTAPAGGKVLIEADGVLAWLGFHRDNMKPEEVESLQNLLAGDYEMPAYAGSACAYNCRPEERLYDPRCPKHKPKSYNEITLERRGRGENPEPSSVRPPPEH